MILFWVLTAILSILLLVVIMNLFSAPRMKNIKAPLSSSPTVSVCIPARNEEHNIGNVLRSLLKSSFPVAEIIVVDDHSTDKTADVVSGLATQDQRIRLIQGAEMPSGWKGKNFACFQAAGAARGDVLLFLDADVVLTPHAVSYALHTMEEKQCAMLSVFPTQIIRSFGEWLIVPLMNWLLLTFLPLRNVYASADPRFVAANGQMIMIRRDLYNAIGTHQQFRDAVVEDMEVAREVKKSGNRMITLTGGDAVYCRMYDGFADAVNGFSKNFYAGFNIGKPGFLLMIIFFMLLFWVPLFLIPAGTVYIIPVVLILCSRVGVSLLSRQNIVFNMLLHWIQMPLMFYIGLRSLTKKDVRWKGRIITS